MTNKTITIIGGGLAGSEAAWQAAERGHQIFLYEMRPKTGTGAHVTDYLAELVCSNSLGSDMDDRAAGLLKNELRRMGSLLIELAEKTAVPAGSALAVDRDMFAEAVTKAIEGHPNITVIREEMTEIPDGVTIIASGPLTSSSLAANYLETFSQTLTYSFAHQDDEDEGIGTTNALSLRNNLAMYDGWGMTLDTGHTWQSPADGESSDRTFIRIDNSIIPNRWMNFTLFYEINWTNTDGREQQQEETGRLIASWVPLASLSLNADVLINDKSGEDDSSSTVQNYFVNWSPFRDGTLQLSLSYSILDDSEGDDTWAFSPRASWQVNKKTMLTCDYSVGERDGERERNEFDTARITLRFFY